MTSQTIPTEYNLDNEPYDLRSIFTAMMKGGLDKRTRDNVGIFLANYMKGNIQRHYQFVEYRELDSAYTKSQLNSLNEIGFVYLDNVFADDEIDRIHDYLSVFPVKYNNSESAIGDARLDTCPVDRIPSGVNFGDYQQDVISRCPWFYKIAHDENLIRLVEAYLGALPTLSIFTAWWSFSSGVEPIDAQLYHHDRADFRSVNLFVYLTDVGPNNGPHVYVKRTHEFRVLYKMIATRLGSDPIALQKFLQWMEVHRKTDRDVETIFTESGIKRHIGVKGTSFLEDTRGLHKGQLPTEGRRLVFQLCYSLLPKYNDSFCPIRRNSINDIEECYLPKNSGVHYTNRLFYF